MQPLMYGKEPGRCGAIAQWCVKQVIQQRRESGVGAIAATAARFHFTYVAVHEPRPAIRARPGSIGQAIHRQHARRKHRNIWNKLLGARRSCSPRRWSHTKRSPDCGQSVQPDCGIGKAHQRRHALGTATED